MPVITRPFEPQAVTPKPPSIPPRRPGSAERLTEAAFGAPGPLRRLAARRAARKGLHAHALACAPEDPYVLARAGFFEQAAEQSKPGSLAWIAAIAGLGRIGLLAEHPVERLPAGERRWIAGLVAAWDTKAALDILGPRMALEAAAACLQLGDSVGAAAQLADEAATPEYWLIQAALSAGDGDWAEASDDIDNLFRDQGLTPPLDGLKHAPTLLDFKAEASVGVTGGALVSVIVAARDAATTLRMAISSLQRQTWKDLEILVIDDGSTDATGTVADELARSDGRIQLIRNAKPLGAAGARNRGLKAATGAYITFHDADDWAHGERIERQVRAAGAPGAVASVARHFRLGANGAPVSPRVFPLLRLCPITLLAGAEAVRAAGPLEDEPVGTDSEYLARFDLLFGRPAAVRMDEVLVVAGWDGGSLSGAASTGLVSAEGRALREAYERDWRARHAERLREMAG